MKNQKVNLKQISILLIMAFSFWSCSDKKSSTPTTTYTYTNGVCMASTGQQVDPANCGSPAGNFVMSNGICINSQTGAQAPVTSCTNTGVNNGFTLYNGACYVTSTGQQVAATNCTAMSGGQQCYGSYYYQSNYGYQMVQCSGANCRGYSLLDSSGRTVTCQ